MGVRHKGDLGFFWALEQEHLWPISRACGGGGILSHLIPWGNGRYERITVKKVKWEELMGNNTESERVEMRKKSHLLELVSFHKLAF